MSILRIIAVPRDDYSSVVNTIRNRELFGQMSL
jgi:hypothetical protein